MLYELTGIAYTVEIPEALRERACGLVNAAKARKRLREREEESRGMLCSLSVNAFATKDLWTTRSLYANT